MKLFKAVFITLLFFCVRSAFAQDLIYKVTGTEIKCKVQTVEDTITYNEPGDAVHTKFLLKKDVHKIVYSNGTVDSFNPLLPQATLKINADTVAKTVEKPTPVVVVELPRTVDAKEDTIFTTDGKQLTGKVTDIDDPIISYTQSGSMAVQTVAIKIVSYIKYSGGRVENYSKKPDLKAAGKTQTTVAQKTVETSKSNDDLATAVQKWRARNISPPLEIF